MGNKGFVEKNYVFIYISKKTPHFKYILNPVFDLLQKQGDMEATFCYSDEKRKGLSGKNFLLGKVSMAKKPQAIVLMTVWQDEERHLALQAQQQGIAVIMVNHGAMFVRNQEQLYKTSIYPADVNCLWGEHDLKIWLFWNSRDDFVVTGNPSYNPQKDLPLRLEGLPERYALLLTPGLSIAKNPKEFQANLLYGSARNLQRFLPVVVKCHPNNRDRLDFYDKHFYKTFLEPETLLSLLCHSEIILSNFSSSLLPAIYWEKVIFFHNYAAKGYGYEDFRRNFSHVFNFKSDPDWTRNMLESAVRTKKKHYEYFASKPDGKSAHRILSVIRSYIKYKPKSHARLWMHHQMGKVKKMTSMSWKRWKMHLPFFS